MTKTTYEFSMESDDDFLSVFASNLVTVADTVTDSGTDISGGLMDQAIFGPVKDYTCRCGKVSGSIFEGEVCPQCGVLIRPSKTRDFEYGYFQLNILVPNPLYHDIILKKLLKLSKVDIDLLTVPKFRLYLIPDPEGIYPLKASGRARLYITDKELSDGIFLGYGLEGLPFLTRLVDLVSEPHPYFDDKPNLLENLVKNTFTSICRVLPISYRDINWVGGTFTINPINIVYKSILSSAKKIKYYRELDYSNGTEITSYQENPKFWYEVSRLISELQSLYLKSDISFRGTPIPCYPNLLAKKGGLIRGGLLSSRSIFSARTVNAAVQPSDIDISKDELLVPYYMAKNLLRVHLTKRLTTERGYSFRNALDKINSSDKEVDELLSDLDGKFYVYTSRAPCLYKFSILAFKMKINFDKSDQTLKVHPLQNGSFNLDHDGDTMSVFLPITKEAQDEARLNSVPSVNPFYDKDGSPIYSASLEYVYGLYYSTNPEFGDEGINPSSYLCDYKVVDGKKITLGSYLIKSLLAKNLPNGCDIDQYYKLGDIITKKSIKNLTSLLLRTVPRSEALTILNKLMIVSSKGFTESGLSIKFNDFIKVDKSRLSSVSNPLDYSIEEGKLINELKSLAPKDNSLISIVESGARGDYTQVKQVMLSKGVLVDSKGRYLPPITNSLHEGLEFDEFITTISASRRGMVSKSLSTASTGFAYYRISKSMRDIEVTETDCGSTEGFVLKLSRSIGRFLNKDIDPTYTRGTLLTKSLVDDLLERYGDIEVNVRSPLHCKCTNGICSTCYGELISKESPSTVGDRVGIIAASSLSEVMSQAMLKNFHTAGATSMVKKDIRIPDLATNYEVDESNPKATIIKFQLPDTQLVYPIPKDRIVLESGELNSGDVLFHYSVDNNDVTKKFDKLNSIIEMHRPKSPAIYAPIDGVLRFTEVNEGIGILGKLIGSTEVVDIAIPFNEVILIPFGSEVKRGDIISTGNLPYRELLGIVPKDTIHKYLFSDLDNIYQSQGAKISPIHFELYILHLLGEGNSFTGMTRGCLNRSFIQWGSLGYLNQSYPLIFDELKVLGNCNADKIALGTY